MPKNYFLNLAKARKTTYEFSDDKVKDSDIKKILEAGRWAPSCTNIQPWHFIVIKKKETIKRLMMGANYGDFHADPTIIIVLILLKKLCYGKVHSCFRADSGVYDSYMSIAMACLNMALQARELGIDSCILVTKQNITKRILKVEKQDVVPLILGLGYQKKDAFQKRRERKKLSEITSYEYFR